MDGPKKQAAECGSKVRERERRNTPCSAMSFIHESNRTSAVNKLVLKMAIKQLGCRVQPEVATE